MKLLCASVFLAIFCSQFAQAGLIKITGGYTVTDITPDGPLKDFTSGEPVEFYVTIDDSTPDTNSTANEASYLDATGSLRVVGLSSGQEVTTNDGVSLEFASLASLEIRGGGEPPFAPEVIDVLNPIDFISVSQVFNAVDTLPTFYQQLPKTVTHQLDSFGTIGIGNGPGLIDQATFTAPMGSTSTISVVPEPSSFVCMSWAVLACLGWRLIRRRR